MRKAANLPVGRRPDEDMWNKLWDRMVLVLAVCLASLLIFSAASLEWSIYLAVLCLAVWICILLYRHKENCTFFVQVLLVGLGNLAAFLLQRFLAGNALLPSSLNRREIVPAALLCLGVVYILFGLLHSMTANQSASAKTPPQLFPEREYDLQRLDAFLKHGAPLIGIDAPWGDGTGQCNCAQAVLKTFEDKLPVDADTLMKLGAGYAAGMGCMESTCGALIGAVMVAGIVTDGKGTPRISKELLQNFQEKCGATICKDLKEIENGAPLCPCPECVRNAVLALGEVLGE